jgi:hypothetical protein
MGRECSMDWVAEKCIPGFGGKTGRIRLLGTHKHKWENIIKVDPKEIGVDDVDWINLAQNRDKW